MVVGYDLAKVAPEEEEEEATLCGGGAKFVSGVCNAARARTIRATVHGEAFFEWQHWWLNLRTLS